MSDSDRQWPKVAGSAAETVLRSGRVEPTAVSGQVIEPTVSTGPPPTITGAREETVCEGSILNGKYRLEKRIGSGGMGIVYLARDLEHERVAQEEQFVAIKVLRPEYRNQPDLVKSLFEEVKKAQALAGPNIVTVFNCQYDGPDVYMTMQYLEGMTLDRLIDQDFSRGIPWDRARTIIEGIGAGLATAHDHGIIHCDLKPSNIFITLAGAAKILDFGIARAARGRRFRQGEVRGLTREYASPEAIRAWDREQQGVTSTSYRPGERDDIYSLACLSYELLTGRRPFDPDDADEAQQKHRQYPPIAGLSRQRNQVLAKALAFDPASRVDRVEDLVRGLGGQTSPGVNRAWLVGIVVAITFAAGMGYLVTQPKYSTTSPLPMTLTAPSDTKPSDGSARPGPTRIHARELLQKLGIDTTKIGSDGTMQSDDLLALLQKSPRHVQLGSTPGEIQDALKLCRQFEKSCKLEWYADESSRNLTLMPYTLDVTPVTVRDFRDFAYLTKYETVAETQGFAFAVVNGTLRKVPNGNWQNGVNQNQVQAQWAVVGITFSDAEAYCRWKGRRLPTEDEWEYAARGPERHVFSWGNDVASASNHRQFPFTADELTLAGLANAYRGMSGVVWQWVDTADGDGKVLKGGSWSENNPANKRAAVRRIEKPDMADANSGFRCAAPAPAWPDADFWINEARNYGN